MRTPISARGPRDPRMQGFGDDAGLVPRGQVARGFRRARGPRDPRMQGFGGDAGLVPRGQVARGFRTLALCIVSAAMSLPGAIVDRVAITVGTKAITESEIVLRIRLEAFQNGTLPVFTPASRRETAERLIDLKLVEREMDLGHYARTTPADAKTLVAAFTAEHYQSNPEALRLSLATALLTPEDLANELAEQADLLSFLNLRFRPSVQIPDRDIEKYFHENIEGKDPAKPVVLSDVRAGIEQILATQRADLDLETWLRDQRKTTRIIYLVEDLR